MECNTRAAEASSALPAISECKPSFLYTFGGDWWKAPWGGDNTWKPGKPWHLQNDLRLKHCLVFWSSTGHAIHPVQQTMSESRQIHSLSGLATSDPTAYRCQGEERGFVYQMFEGSVIVYVYYCNTKAWWYTLGQDFQLKLIEMVPENRWDSHVRKYWEVIAGFPIEGYFVGHRCLTIL